MLRFFLYSVCVCCLWSCSENNTTRGIDSKEVVKEIKSREIRHITQAQIIEEALKQGQFVSDSVQSMLVQKLTSVITEKGIIEAASYCNLQKLESVSRLEKDYQVTVKRLRLKGNKSGQVLNEIETQLLDAYRYNAENKLSLEQNVQNSGTDYIIFTSPITISSQVCLKCHGMVGKEMLQNDYQILRSGYQMDSLVNYSMNQPLAIYRILLQKKAIIANINAN